MTATSLTASCAVRPLAASDKAQWLPLWEGYNAFYGRSGDTALPAAVTVATWHRLLDPLIPVHAVVADDGGRLLGVAHYLFHATTTRLGPVCYLQDLFTAPDVRRQGVESALIDAVVSAAKAQGAERLYWHTQFGNQIARALYDQVAEHQGFIVYSRELRNPLS